MLHTLNIYNVICQLYPYKTGKNSKKWEVTASGYELPFGVIKVVENLNLILVMVQQCCEYTKQQQHLIIPFK